MTKGVCWAGKNNVRITNMSCSKSAMQCASFVGQFGMSPRDTMGTFGGGLSTTDSAGRLRCMNPHCSRPLVSKNYACKRCGGSQHIEGNSSSTGSESHQKKVNQKTKPETSEYDHERSNKTISLAESELPRIDEFWDKAEEVRQQYEKEKEKEDGNKEKTDTLFDEWSAKKKVYYRERDAVNKRIHDSMKVDDPTEITFINSGNDGLLSAFIQEKISRRVLPKELGAVVVDFAEGRSGYSTRNHVVNNVNAGVVSLDSVNVRGWINIDISSLGKKNEIKRGISHELGHHIEDNDEKSRRVAIAYWEARTAGLAYERIANMMGLTEKQDKEYFKENDVGKEGGFITAYTGKVYKNDDDSIRSTEVISVGLEQMMKNPVYFYEEDPDHFEFMVRLLRGEFHSDRK